MALVCTVMHAVVDFSATTMANSDAKRLYDDLLRKSGYNKLIRPVINNTDKLYVRLGLRLSQLIDVVCIHCSTIYTLSTGLALSLCELSYCCCCC